MIPYFAIGLYAGLRTSELLELEWNDISQTYIRVTPSVAKSRRSRLVPISDTLKRLIEPVRQASGKLVTGSADHVRRKVIAVAKEAGIKTWPHNGMRHSWASYYLAATNDAAKTSAHLGHADVGVVYEHYREVVTPEAAEAYFKADLDPKPATNQQKQT